LTAIEKNLLPYWLTRFPRHELTGVDPHTAAKKVRSLGEQGDPLAMRVFEQQATALGRLFTIASNFTDPSAYFIGGGVVEASPDFREWFLSRVKAHTALRAEQRDVAQFAVVPVGQLTPKPPEVPWEAAGALYVAGATAYAAVRAVALKPGDTVAVAGAAGGVGTIAVQLAKRLGATVLGIASLSNDEWLTAHGVVPVNYGDDLAERLRGAAPGGRITVCGATSSFSRLINARVANPSRSTMRASGSKGFDSIGNHSKLG